MPVPARISEYRLFARRRYSEPREPAVENLVLGAASEIQRQPLVIAVYIQSAAVLLDRYRVLVGIYLDERKSVVLAERTDKVEYAVGMLDISV